MSRNWSNNPPVPLKVVCDSEAIPVVFQAAVPVRNDVMIWVTGFVMFVLMSLMTGAEDAQKPNRDNNEFPVWQCGTILVTPGR